MVTGGQVENCIELMSPAAGLLRVPQSHFWRPEDVCLFVQQCNHDASLVAPGPPTQVITSLVKPDYDT